jgi:hypothetical protein
MSHGNSRGVEIADFCMYPKEREFLYPVSEVRGERERGAKVDKGWGKSSW